MEIAICTSNIENEKKLLHEYVIKAGVHRVNEINDANYLIMSELQPTQKALIALASGKFIVNCMWLKAIFSRTNLSDPLPNPESFLPEVDNKEGIDIKKEMFLQKKERSKLLEKKKFVFFNENQFKSLKDVVSAAGGTSTLHSDIEDEKFYELNQDHCFVLPSTEETIPEIAKKIQHSFLYGQ